MTKNSFGIYFWTKYISVLLAAFVFVTGMMITGSAIAASDVGLNPIAYGKDSFTKSSYEVKVDGLQGVKHVNSKSYDNETRNDNFYTAKFVKGTLFRLHYIYKPEPADAVNDFYGQPFETRNWTISMTMTVKEKDKVIKEISKSFTNQNDNYVEYKLPQKTTQVIVTVSGKEVLANKDIKTKKPKSRRTVELEKGERYVLVTTLIGSGNEKDGGDGTDKPSDDGSTDVDSGGIGIVYLGGGLFAVVVGGAAIFFFTGTGGSAGAGAAGSMPEPPEPPEPEPEPPAPPEPDYYLYKDPAGFETLYMKDPETGQWYNYQDYEEGYRVPVDMDKLQEYDAQRQKDVKWNQDQMTKLENRETGLDKELKQEYQDMLEREKKIQEETRKDLYALKTNTFGLDNAERKRVLADRQEKLEAVSNAENRKAAILDATVKTLEVVEKGADMSISVLATVTPGGNLVANIYTGVKNVAKEGMQASADGKSIVGGMLKGAVKGGADILQNLSGDIPATKWGYKLAAYASTEAMKEGIVAGMEGESILKATFKGLVQGGSKFAVDQLGSMIGDKVHTSYDMPAKEAAMREKYLKIRDNWSKELQPKTIKALREMNFQRYFAKDPARVLQQGMGQTLANEASAAAYDMGVEGKSFTESAFGDKW